MPSFASARSISSASKPTFKPVIYRLETSTTDPTSGTWRNNNATNYRFIQGLGLVLRNEKITDMTDMLLNNTSFNDPGVINWDVSVVTSMRGLFSGSSNFNQDISGWDTSSVEFMDSMFEGATAFNQDLTGWDVSSVTINNQFSSGANSSWTLKPTNNFVFSSSFTIERPFYNTTSQTLFNTYHIPLFTGSDLAVQGVSISGISSLQLTSTAYIQPSPNNHNDQTMTFIGQNNAYSGSVNYYLQPGSDNLQFYYNPSGVYNPPPSTFYTGNLLPYIWYPNGNYGFAADTYYITVFVETKAYTTTWVPGSLFGSGSWEYNHLLIQVVPQFTVTSTRTTPF